MLTIKIRTDSASFEETGVADQLQLLLAEVGQALIDGRTEGIIKDYNGASVGTYKLTGVHKGRTS